MARTKKNAGKNTGGAAALPPTGKAANVDGSVGQMVVGGVVVQGDQVFHVHVHVHGASAPGLVIHLHINGQGVASCS